MAKRKDWICFDTPELDRSEKSAIKALSKGEASEYQQQLALSVIVKKLARTNDIPFVPGWSDQSAFMAARAFVGTRIQKILSQPVDGSAPIEEGKTNG